MNIRHTDLAPVATPTEDGARSFPRGPRLGRFCLPLLFGLLACSSGCTSATNDGGAGPPADLASVDLATSDAALPLLSACPTQGAGAIIAPGPCVVFTPAQAGADSTGANANLYQFALEPGGTAKGQLVVHLNGSLGSPVGQIADPQKNIYSALAQAGFHVIGLAYRSTTVVGVLCNGAPACFAPTRRSIVLGTYTTGAPASLASIRADEGIVQRLDAALGLLAAARPTGGWGQFRGAVSDPDVTQRILWPKVIASGHSQGGGHAAFLGSLVPLRRVVQLSSTCDYTSGVAAPWTSATASWATVPQQNFVGFAAPTTFGSGTPTAGDTTCPYHFAVWQNMGMHPTRMYDDAATCGATGDTHGASIGCTDNFPRWPTLFQ
jgi:hypothetical protein